jgi:hypothetical protein
MLGKYSDVKISHNRVPVGSRDMEGKGQLKEK